MNTSTYHFDLCQFDPNKRSEHLVKKTFEKIFDMFFRQEFDKEHIDLSVLS